MFWAAIRGFCPRIRQHQAVPKVVQGDVFQFQQLAARRIERRQRREWREQQRELQDRAQHQAIPGRDDGPPPRID